MKTIILSIIGILFLDCGLNAESDAAWTDVTAAGPVDSPEILDGDKYSARLAQPRGLSIDKSGNLYVTEEGGCTVRIINKDSEISTLAGFARKHGYNDGHGGNVRFRTPLTTAINANNEILIADSQNQTIRKANSAGEVVTIAGLAGFSGAIDGPGSEARFVSPLAITASDNGAAYVADADYTIRCITVGGSVKTIAGDHGNSGSIDGAGSNARFISPNGITADKALNIYIADSCTIRKITPDGHVTTLAGSPNEKGHVDGPATQARFRSLQGIAVDSSGNIFVSDEKSHVIRRLDTNGQVITWAGQPDIQGSEDGVGSEASFRKPAGLVIDGTGCLYVADFGNHIMRKIDTNRVVTTFAGIRGGSGKKDGSKEQALFNFPYSAVRDGVRTLITDTLNHTIRVLSPTGVVSTLAGTAGHPGSQDGMGVEARFDHPSGAASDEAGNLFVADWGNHTIRKISPAGHVTTIAGLAGNWGNTDGNGSNACFFHPVSVAIDRSNCLYVADSVNCTIRKIQPSGQVTTLAGLPGIPGCKDGVGSAARFYLPCGVAVDEKGFVYVADSHSSTIRKISPPGEVTTVAGSAFIRGYVDGHSIDARFGYPSGIAVDGLQNLYVADMANRAIRKISAEGEVTTLIQLSAAGAFLPEPYWYPSVAPSGRGAFFPCSVTVDNTGDLLVADNIGNRILMIQPACPDKPTLDWAATPVGVPRKLDAQPRTATSWQWSIIRRPANSTAELSSTTIPNPTFTPDVADLYVFRLQATNAAGAISVGTVELNAVSSTIIANEAHPELTNQVFRASFPTAPGRNYVLESAESADSTSWTASVSTLGDGGLKTLTDSVKSVVRRCYRIRVE